MIHQYLFGRRSQGYQQLNDLGRSGYSPGDIKNFESVNEYSVLPRLDLDDLPECMYFYNENTALGHIGVFGRTFHVPAGKSEESGSRVTTFVHKYLFSDSDFAHDYTDILTDPERLFRIGRFCKQVEDTYDYDTEHIQYKELSVLPDLSEVFTKLGLPKTEDFLKKLLWNLIECSGTNGKKTYIVFPENTKEMSIYAQYLWLYLYKALPLFVRANSGFLSYAHTFDDAQLSHIPSGATLVFVANTEDNRNKYANVRLNHYLYDFSYGLEAATPEVFTQESAEGINVILEELKSQCLEGKESQECSLWWKIIDDRFPAYTRFGMEELANTIEFYQYYTRMSENDDTVYLPSAYDMRRILHYMLTEEKHRTAAVKADVEQYIKYFFNRIYLDKPRVTKEDIDLDMLDVLGDWCLFFPDSFQMAVNLFQKLLRLCSQDMEVFCGLLDYSFSSAILNEQIRKQLYDNSEFEDVACIYYEHEIQVNLQQQERAGKTDESRVDYLLSAVLKMERLSGRFVKSEGAIKIFDRYFKRFVVETENPGQTSYLKRLRTYWVKLNRLSSGNPTLSAYGKLLDSSLLAIAGEMFSGENLKSVEDSALLEFANWKHDMKNDTSLGAMEDLWKKADWEKKYREYSAAFDKEPNDLYRFLDVRLQEESNQILMQSWFIDAAKDYIERNSTLRIIREQRDSYCILMADFYGRYEAYRELILSKLFCLKEDKLSILAQFYYEVKQNAEMNGMGADYVQEARNAISANICEMYQKDRIKIVDLRQESEFVEELGLEYILEENSVKGKFRSLGNKGKEWVKLRLDEHIRESEDSFDKEESEEGSDNSFQNTVDKEEKYEEYTYYDSQTNSYSNSNYEMQSGEKDVSQSGGRLEVSESSKSRIRSEQSDSEQEGKKPAKEKYKKEKPEKGSKKEEKETGRKKSGVDFWRFLKKTDN